MGFGGGLGRGDRPAGPPGGAGRRRPQAAGNRRRRFALRAGLRVCRGLRGAGNLQGVGGKAGARGGQEGAGGRSGPQAKPSGGRFRRAKPAGPGGAGAACGPVSPPAQNGPRSYRNRKTVSAAREWWRRSGRPTTVQGVSAPVRRTVSGTRYFCARLTLRGCSTLAPCSAISSISS